MVIKYMWYKNLASYSSKHMYGSPGGTRTFALLSNATNCPLPDILTSATRKSLSIPIGPCPAPSEVYKVDFTSIEAYNTHLFL